jgi:hypothetical protein
VFEIRVPADDDVTGVDSEGGVLQVLQPLADGSWGPLCPCRFPGLRAHKTDPRVGCVPARSKLQKSHPALFQQDSKFIVRKVLSNNKTLSRLNPSRG